jgi:hypothetical protein
MPRGLPSYFLHGLAFSRARFFTGRFRACGCWSARHTDMAIDPTLSRGSAAARDVLFRGASLERSVCLTDWRAVLVVLPRSARRW